MKCWQKFSRHWKINLVESCFYFIFTLIFSVLLYHEVVYYFRVVPQLLIFTLWRGGFTESSYKVEVHPQRSPDQRVCSRHNSFTITHQLHTHKYCYLHFSEAATEPEVLLLGPEPRFAAVVVVGMCFTLHDTTKFEIRPRWRRKKEENLRNRNGSFC